jgi:hypothetical protein
MARRSPIATETTPWPRQSRVLDGPRDGEVTWSASFAVLGNPEKQDGSDQREALLIPAMITKASGTKCFVCGLPP